MAAVLLLSSVDLPPTCDDVMFIYSSDENNRVCLEFMRGVDGSDYINASHVDVRRLSYPLQD